MTATSAGNPQKSDDLKAISGIGVARENLLRESLGVHTFQDLAALSVDEIESRLREEGQFVSRDEIEQWIAQAQELATAEGNEEEPAAPSGPGWESAATFVVEFQVSEEGEERRTKVHHMEEDADADWPDFEHVHLCRWMLEQLGEPAPELPEDTLAEARQEVQQMRTDAQQELQEELEAERTRLQQRLEQELEERKTEAHDALQAEIKEARTKAQEELEEELEAERSRLQKEIEQELEERKAQAQQSLDQDLQQARADARQELQEDLEAERDRLRREIDRELEERKAEAQDAFQHELEETRARAQEKLEEELEAERARLQQEMEQQLEERRAQAQEALAPEPKEPAAEEEAPKPEPEAPAEVAGAREPVAVEQPPELKIGEFRVYQPPQAETPRIVGKSLSSPDALRRDTPFSLVGSFSVEEAQADELAGKGVTYTAQFQAREISTGETRQLGTMGPEAFAASKSTYEARLPDVKLAAGLYLLTAFVTTDTTPPGGVYRQVSTFLVA